MTGSTVLPSKRRERARGATPPAAAHCSWALSRRWGGGGSTQSPACSLSTGDKGWARRGQCSLTWQDGTLQGVGAVGEGPTGICREAHLSPWLQRVCKCRGYTQGREESAIRSKHGRIQRQHRAEKGSRSPSREASPQRVPGHQHHP